MSEDHSRDFLGHESCTGFEIDGKAYVVNEKLQRMILAKSIEIS